MEKSMRKSLGSLLAVSVFCGCGDLTGELNWNKKPKPIAAPNPQSEAEKFAPAQAGVVIVLPRNHPKFDEPLLEIQGSYACLPQGWQLFAFLEDRYRYYLQYPPLRISPARKTFSQRNIRVGNGVHTLHVCLVNPQAGRLLEERANQNDWRGFTNLPEGIFICDSVALK